MTTADVLIEDPFSGFSGEDKRKAHPKKFQKNSKKKFQKKNCKIAARPPPAPKRTPPGITLPQLQRHRDAQRVVQEGGDGDQAGQVAGHGSAVRGAEGNRGRVVSGGVGQAPGKGAGASGSARGRTQVTGQSAQQGERARARAGRQCQQQRGRTGTRGRPGRGQPTEGHGARQRTWASAREGLGRRWKRQGRR